jgi:TP901 family phage tail tape measure protein
MPGKSFNVVTKFLAHDGVTKKLKKMGKAASGVARQGAIITAAASAAVVSIFNVNKEFQLSMNRIEARLGNATGDQLKQLETMAKQLGKTTAFSASQAADGMGFLAMAGWKTNQILAATPDLLNLAAAAEMDLARAADITSNIMGAFEMDATRAGEATDVLAALTSSANVDMEMLADTFKMAAPLANAYGATLKDTGTAVGFLGNLGIQGTNAGTAMKGLFSVMSNPPPKAAKWFEELNIQTSKIDKNGKRVMRDFSGTMAELGKKLNKMSQPERLKALGDIFGKIVGPSAIALANDLAKTDSQFVQLGESMKDVEGRADKMAKIMMQGAPGAVAEMMAAIEGLTLAIGESGLLGSMVKAIQKFTEFMSKLTEHAPTLTKTLGAVFAIAAAVTALSYSIILVNKIWGVWIAAVKLGAVAIKSLSIVTKLWAGAMKILNIVMAVNPIFLVVGAVALLVLGFGILVKKTGGVMNAINAIGDAVMGVVRAVGQFLGLIDEDKDFNVRVDKSVTGDGGGLKPDPEASLMENILQGTGMASDIPGMAQGSVDVNVFNKSPEQQDVQATSNGTGLKMKLNTGT